MSGMILVNGKVESSQSYKRIIGFVSQDDIVYGNLTLEENLWFSARCRMFDDLILLAKGGLICYQGSVKKVEEYFSSLGIVVPEHVNPPDYYIDLLEGILKPSTSSGVTYKQLPVRWMLHNGYPVPSDMLKRIEGMASASAENSAHGSVVGDDGTSFAGEFWQDCRTTSVVLLTCLKEKFLVCISSSDTS